MVRLKLGIRKTSFSCGGNNVYIEVNQGQTVCQTAHKWDFYGGQTLSTWKSGGGTNQGTQILSFLC